MTAFFLDLLVIHLRFDPIRMGFDIGLPTLHGTAGRPNAVRMTDGHPQGVGFIERHVFFCVQKIFNHELNLLFGCVAIADHRHFHFFSRILRKLDVVMQSP